MSIEMTDENFAQGYAVPFVVPGRRAVGHYNCIVRACALIRRVVGGRLRYSVRESEVFSTDPVLKPKLERQLINCIYFFLFEGLGYGFGPLLNFGLGLVVQN